MNGEMEVSWNIPRASKNDRISVYMCVCARVRESFSLYTVMYIIHATLFFRGVRSLCKGGGIRMLRLQQTS